MSYKCEDCAVVCWHRQYRVVTETRARARDGGREIVREQAFCTECVQKRDGTAKIFHLPFSGVLDTTPKNGAEFAL